MGSICGVTVLLCAHVAVTSPESLVEKKHPQLHEHPTIVRMWRENNMLRSRIGLRPQRLNPRLTRAAQNHAWFMARTHNFSHHSNGGPSGRVARFGYRGGGVRENIAMGQRSIRGVFQSWRNSSGHWANITSPASEAGFGYAIAPDGATYWVAVYGDGETTTWSQHR